MYTKEIVKAICENHQYSYCVANKAFEIIRYSKDFFTYCEMEPPSTGMLNLFDVVLELVGMEEALNAVFQRKQETLCIPLVLKASESYVNISVKYGTPEEPFIVLFEDVTQRIHTRQYLRQVSNENLLLLEEIEDKNRELKRLNQEIQKRVEEEVSKNMEKQHLLELQTRHAQMGEMIAMITHQWKQPLSVMQTIGGTLKMKHNLGIFDKDFFIQKLDTLLHQIDYLNQTVNDFQMFFKPSKEKVLFPIQEALASVLELMKEEYLLQNIDIVLGEMCDVTIFGYENEYKQVILAILQNAKDAFINTQQPNRRIMITIGQRDGASLLTIEDNAGGIPLEILPNVFSQYMTTKNKGSGLGLHIAKSVIENNMQGRLWVENTQEGARFFIEV